MLDRLGAVSAVWPMAYSGLDHGRNRLERRPWHVVEQPAAEQRAEGIAGERHGLVGCARPQHWKSGCPARRALEAEQSHRAGRAERASGNAADCEERRAALWLLRLQNTVQHCRSPQSGAGGPSRDGNDDRLRRAGAGCADLGPLAEELVERLAFNNGAVDQTDRVDVKQQRYEHKDVNRDQTENRRSTEAQPLRSDTPLERQTVENEGYRDQRPDH